MTKLNMKFFCEAYVKEVEVEDSAGDWRKGNDTGFSLGLMLPKLWRTF